ncbi:hypothetical protein [uncultured Pseudodesulfovibrio sp.]|uniref:hypothetical protein n=1 Tax=uncultured Pseudodesulfovibrio sp. TaxID=2035858 RepID=UPI0029C71DA1|nr:hypothetical protein [uncultured Pseudodesulfovibrio sp.]
MATQSIGSFSYSGASSLLNMSGQNGTQQAGKVSPFQAGKNLRSQIRAQIDDLLKDVPKGTDGKLSFKDIDDYREKLGKEWDESVKADLEKLGVDVEKEFPLSWDTKTGKLTVSKEHPDKEVIDKYFESNPEKVEEFQKIVQLGKMTRTHEQKLTPQQLQKSIQQESVAWWYEDNSDPTSWFQGGGRLMSNTQAAYSGLNLKV